MIMLTQSVIFIISVLFVKCDSEQDNLLVDTKLGYIRGLKSDNGDYLMFLGIPYALVNITNPFGDAINHPKFNDTFEATDDTVICPQIQEFTKKYRGTFDCLRLNIYVPNGKRDSKLPILLYIHGGNFNEGNGGRYMYGPKYLVRHDIIVVTLNYRLGPYGFICTDTPKAPGNQGLKDQYMAIEWVKNNIVSFGGDPNKITLAGHSMGAISVDIHMMSKRPRLFQQAILQSGSAFYPNKTRSPDNTLAINLAEKLGFKTNEVSKAIDFLITQNPKNLIMASNDIYFDTCMENENVGDSRLISQHPSISDAPNVYDINILTGYTDKEWMLGLCNTKFIYKFAPQIISNDLNTIFNIEHLEKVVKKVRKFYFGDKQVDMSTKYNTVDFLTDFEIIYPIHRSVTKYKNHRNVNIFMYFFIYNGNRNFLKRMYNFLANGAVHADELSYIFDVSTMNEEPNVQDTIIIDRMTTLWTNFIKYGNPTPTTSELINVQWPQYTDHTQAFLQINNSLSIVHQPFPQRIAFWETLFNDYKDKLRH